MRKSVKSNFALDSENQKMKNLFLTMLLTAVCSAVFSQSGFVRGKITDAATGEGLFGATITKQGTIQGTVADFDGNYSLSLEAGIHTLVIQSISYQTTTIEGVEILDGEVNALNIPLSEDVQQLESVVVTAGVIQNNDAAILSVQKKSINTMDGISSATFKKVGDSNLSSAMKRVTGVTVQGGKYIYVRGLGDRYTKTALNGMVMPGLDPDRNDVQMDLFPTSILENVIVYKTFTPNLNGDFAGGLVNIQTKSFPEEKATSISVGLGYNPQMHLKSGIVSQSGSSSDFIGLGNSDRELPIAKNSDVDNYSDASLADATRAFSSDLGTKRATNFLNTSFSLSHRNQVQRQRVTWGYNAILSYKKTNTYYGDFTRKNYEKDKTGEAITMARDYTAIGDMGIENVLWSGLVSLAAKVDNHTISTNFLHTQNGISTSVDRFMQKTALNNPIDIHNDILTYNQRSMTNNITNGKHSFGKLRVEWSNSLLLSKMSDPDYRDTRITEDEDGRLGFSNGGTIDRFWRELEEVSESFKMDFTYDLNEKNKIKAGALGSYSAREFDVYSYSYNNQEITSLDDTDPDLILTEENLFSTENTKGLSIRDDSNDLNNYDGKQHIYAGYVMNEMHLTERLKSIYGVRVEHAEMFYTGTRKNADNSEELVNNLKTLNETNLLPSLSLVYALKDDMNLRASFNKTLARPSFKEKSSAFIDDPITDIRFSGNLDLNQAQIMNYDLRWEYFMKSNEMFSVSLFYKDFTDHIALVFFENATDQVKPRNVGDAFVFGTEMEFRKGLGFIAPSLNKFSVGSNVSLVVSEVDRKSVVVNEVGLNEYEADVEYQETTDGVSSTREMTGQSPYVINGFINYDDNELGISGNISYNVQGETITLIGVSEAPNVYTKPFNSLNLKVSWQIGETRNSSISFLANNLLNDDKKQVYKFDNEERLFSKFNPGQTFTVKYGYTF